MEAVWSVGLLSFISAKILKAKKIRLRDIDKLDHKTDQTGMDYHVERHAYHF